MFIYAGKSRVEKNLYVESIFSREGSIEFLLWKTEVDGFLPSSILFFKASVLASSVHLLIKSQYV